MSAAASALIGYVIGAAIVLAVIEWQRFKELRAMRKGERDGQMGNND